MSYSHFGFYNEKEEIVEMKDQKVSWIVILFMPSKHAEGI